MTDDSTASIMPGSRVLMHYSITLEEGTVADSSYDGEPLEFVMGDGTLLEGLERALYGLQAGQHQSLRIPPLEGFGFRDTDNIHPMARSEFQADMQLEPGVIIDFTTPSGASVPGMIREVAEDVVQVDFNHPLAGHEITFKVDILEVTPAIAEDFEQKI